MVKLFLQSIAIAPTATASRCSSWFISHSLKRCRSISSTTIALPKASKIKSASAQMSSTTQFTFGPYKIDAKEVFYSTPLSYAMVNLRPLLPDFERTCGIGRWRINTSQKPFNDVLKHEHVLVCPRREAKRFADLTADETTDLWLTAQKVGKQLESYHKGSSTTFAIQDGPQAGQTVPHVHIHVLPRKAGDFEKNDEIYDAIEVKEKELQQKLDLDKERKDRSLEEMNQEADQYRREVKRFADLTADEICDLWLTARKVGRQLEVYHKASSLTLNIQDGPQAGQSVPHVHIHIVPRKESDFENNDDIYDALDVKKELKKKLDLDEERKDRSPEERIQEANEYRSLFL